MIRESIEALFGMVEGIAGAAAPMLFLLLLASLSFTSCALFATFGGWLERKLIARVHSRRGPVYTGPFGLLQTVADLLKFLRKEVVFPKGADRKLFALAPFLLCLPPFLALTVVPIGSFTLIESDYSLLIVLALLGMGPIAVLVGAWASNSKYSTLGGLRGAGMMMAYEVLLAVSIASLALAAGTLDINQIIAFQAEQGVWFALLQPLAFVLFLIAATASIERNPFDLIEAESELVSGWKTEYGGVYFSLTLLGEYVKLLVMALLCAALFLGGGSDLAFLLKAALFVLGMFYIRATAIRITLDRLFTQVWHRLIPIGLLNFLATALLPFAMEAFL